MLGNVCSCSFKSSIPLCTITNHIDIHFYHTYKTISGKDRCRQPDIFHIQPWARRDTLFQAVSAYLMPIHAYPRVFSPSRAVTLMYFPCNRGTFKCVIFACFCAYFQYILWNQIILFSSLKARKMIKRYL